MKGATDRQNSGELDLKSLNLADKFQTLEKFLHTKLEDGTRLTCEVSFDLTVGAPEAPKYHFQILKYTKDFRLVDSHLAADANIDNAIRMALAKLMKAEEESGE